MKKTKFFTLALLSAAVVFTTSCSDDDDAPLAPSLSITETTTGTSGGSVEIEEGQELEFAWESRKGDNNIKTFSLSISGSYSTTDLETYGEHQLPYSVSGGDRHTYVDTIAFPSAGLNLGSTNYTFTVSDGTNSKSVSYNVTVVTPEAETTPLSEAESFEWKRVGGNDGQGLSAFGLKWTDNLGGKAIVAIDGSVMYNLPSASWTSLETQEDLAAAMSAATSIQKYEGVSTDASANYDDVLAVSYNDTNYLIHVTSSDVSTGAEGTTIKIYGEYKN